MPSTFVFEHAHATIIRKLIAQDSRCPVVISRTALDDTESRYCMHASNGIWAMIVPITGASVRDEELPIKFTLTNLRKSDLPAAKDRKTYVSFDFFDNTGVDVSLRYDKGGERKAYLTTNRWASTSYIADEIGRIIKDWHESSDDDPCKNYASVDMLALADVLSFMGLFIDFEADIPPRTAAIWPVANENGRVTTLILRPIFEQLPIAVLMTIDHVDAINEPPYSIDEIVRR